jgi:hypothetical protein
MPGSKPKEYTAVFFDLYLMSLLSLLARFRRKTLKEDVLLDVERLDC